MNWKHLDFNISDSVELSEAERAENKRIRRERERAIKAGTLVMGGPAPAPDKVQAALEAAAKKSHCSTLVKRERNANAVTRERAAANTPASVQQVVNTRTYSTLQREVVAYNAAAYHSRKVGNAKKALKKWVEKAAENKKYIEPKKAAFITSVINQLEATNYCVFKNMQLVGHLRPEIAEFLKKFPDKTKFYNFVLAQENKIEGKNKNVFSELWIEKSRKTEKEMLQSDKGTTHKGIRYRKLC